jgi:hypothetical protein
MEMKCNDSVKKIILVVHSILHGIWIVLKMSQLEIFIWNPFAYRLTDAFPIPSTLIKCVSEIFYRISYPLKMFSVVPPSWKILHDIP